MSLIALNNYQHVAGGGILILITAATVEDTGFLPGFLYEFVAIDGGALCRWGADDATIADGGFDFAVPKNGGPIYSWCPTGDSALNVIESDGASVATAVLLASRLQIV